MQEKIKGTLMRSGTSRGPFLDMRDLPSDSKLRDKILLKIIGSPNINQIDGLGGGSFVTSKIVMVQPSERKGIDVDYLFAQVIIEDSIVDTKPTCGNMMAGVAPFALERGWVKPGDPETKVMVYNINTKSAVEIVVQTPKGVVNYTNGNEKIDGVEGTGSPIYLNYLNVFGGATGKLFPTNNSRDVISNVEVSLVDSGNFMMLIKAESLGLTGLEDVAFFENNSQLKSKIEAIRVKAGAMSGLGDVSKSVIPKVGILSSPRIDGTIKSQYLTPHSLHPSHAVTGAICIAVASRHGNTVASDLAKLKKESSQKIVIEHPSGTLAVKLEINDDDENTFSVKKAGVIRTARKIMDGNIYY